MQEKKKAPLEAATSKSANVEHIQGQDTTKQARLQGLFESGHLLPAAQGETFSLGGTAYPVMGYVAGEGGPVPLVDVPMMTDYEWQLSCLESRLQHPEVYAQFENVEETVAKLRQWLEENALEGKTET